MDNAIKDPNFLNGFFTPPGDEILDDKFLSPTKAGDGETGSKQPGTTDAGSVATAAGDDEKTAANEVSKIDISRDNNNSINNSVIEDLFDRRRRWGRGISIYRLVDGKF